MPYIDQLKVSIEELRREIHHEKIAMRKNYPDADGSMGMVEYTFSMDDSQNIAQHENALRAMEEQLWMLEPDERPDGVPPTEVELKQLPRWARVAFAARCARRHLHVAENYCGVEAVREGILAIEKSSESGRAGIELSRPLNIIRSKLSSLTSTREVASLLGPGIFDYVPSDARGDRAATAIVRAIEATLKAAEEKDHESAALAATLAEGLPVASLREIVDDWRILSRLSIANSWSDKTPFPRSTWAVHSTFDLEEAIEGQSILDVSSVINGQLIAYFQKYPTRLYELESRQFEELIAELFTGFGYLVELTSRTRDSGRDVIAVRHSPASVRYLIECKRWARNRHVGVGVIRQLYGVVEAESATKGILATTSWITRDARRFLRPIEFRLEARDFDGLIEWLDTYQKLRIS